MLSVSYIDTDNTDHTVKTITHVDEGLDWGLDWDWGLGSDSAWLSEQAQASGCRTESELDLGSDSVPDLVVAQESASVSESAMETDSVFDSAPVVPDSSLALEPWLEPTLRFPLRPVHVVVNDGLERRCAPA